VSDEDVQRRAWRTEQSWQELRERIQAAEENAAPSRRRMAPLLAAAAALIAAVGYGALTLSELPAPSSEHPLVVTTGPGQRAFVRLPDSSLAVLGPTSRLSYSAQYGTREVRLTGIASFDVPHDASRPFVVRARNAVATDLGTAFVVRAYDSDSTVEVSVSAGMVRLSDSSSARAIDLRPQEAGRVSPTGSLTTVAWSIVESGRAWIDGHLVFRNAPARDVVADLGRWFDVEIRVASALEQRRVSAVYNSPTLDGVLGALAATLQARVEREGRVITLSPRAR